MDVTAGALVSGDVEDMRVSKVTISGVTFAAPHHHVIFEVGMVALGFVIYLVATGLAFVNPYLGLGVITAMWGFWSVIAYRALNRHGRWSADASGGGSDVGSEE